MSKFVVIKQFLSADTLCVNMMTKTVSINSNAIQTEAYLGGHGPLNSNAIHLGGHGPLPTPLGFGFKKIKYCIILYYTPITVSLA